MNSSTITKRPSMPNHKTGRITLAVLLIFSSPSLLVDGQCSGTTLNIDVDLDPTFVTSIGYNNGAGTYTSNLDCKWLLDSGNSTVKLLMYIENYDVKCIGDVINIYDGSTTGSSRLATNLCGNSNSPVYVTSGQTALMTFISDGSVQGAGFKLVVMGATENSGSGCTTPEVLTPTSTKQYLTSPAFPGLYTVDSDCQWTIKSTGKVALDVLFTDIETSTNCAFDGLIIYDGEYTCSQIIALAACKPYPNGPTLSYVSNGTSITIKFKSDSSISHYGFVLKYYDATSTTAAPPSNGGNLTSGLSDTGDDTSYLIAGIAFLTGFSCALASVGLFILVKHIYKRSKRTLVARSRQVSPQLSVPRSRNNSTCGSTASDDSFRHNGYTSTPISLNSSLALSTTSGSHRHSNGVLKHSNGLIARQSLPNGTAPKHSKHSNGVLQNNNKQISNGVVKNYLSVNGVLKTQKGK